MTTVSPIVKSVRAANHPYVLDCRMPSTTKNRPSADRIAPSRSNCGAASVRGGSVIRSAMTMIVATISTCRMKEARQLMALVTRPPISGPAAAPRPAAPLTMPKYLARDRRVGEGDRDQDVDRRDHQRGADALEQ